MKRLLAFFTSAVLLLSLLPIGAFATGDAETDAVVTLESGAISYQESGDNSVELSVKMTKIAPFTNFKFSVDYDSSIFDIDFITGTSKKNQYLGATPQTNGSEITFGVAEAIDEEWLEEGESELLLFKIKLTAKEKPYNGDYTVTLNNAKFAEVIKGKDNPKTINNPTATVTVTGGNEPTLTKVSLAQGEETVLTMTDSWAYGVEVNGVNDVTFAASTYAEDTANNVALSATWTTEDSALSVSGSSITVAKDASAGAHVATATYNQVSKDFTFNVTRAAAAANSVTVSGGQETIAVPTGDTAATSAQFTASVKDQFGDDMNADVTWTVTDGNGNSVSGITIDDGVVSVSRSAAQQISGTSKVMTVTAAAGGKSDTKSITVTREASNATSVVISGGQEAIEVPADNAAANTASAFTATVTDQYGAAMDTGAVTWSITETTGVSINANGVVTVSNDAKDAITTTTGTALTVTAAVGSLSDTATITVRRAASVATTMTVSGGQEAIEIPAGDTAATGTAFTASLKDQYGAAMDTGTVQWLITPTTGVSISNGVVSVDKTAKDAIATATGTALTVTATASGKSDTATITVKRAGSVVTSVAIFSGNAAVTGTDIIGIPGSKSYTAKVYDQYGAEMTGESATLALNNAADGITIADGTVTVADTTADEGTATLTASCGNASASLTVQARSVSVNWDSIAVKESITYGDAKRSAFTALPDNGTATAYVNNAETTLNGTFAIENPDELLTAGDNKSIVVRFTVTSAGDYQGNTFSKTYTVNVDKKTVELSWTGTASRVYDGADSNVTASVTNRVGTDTVIVTVSGGTEKNADTHTAEATGLDNDNYKLPDAKAQKTATYIITPLTAELSWSGADDLVYSGSQVNVTASVTNKVTGDTVNVTVTGGTEKNAGTHTATATALSSGNYALPAAKTRTYSIAQRVLTITGVTATNRDYAAGNKTVALTGGTLVNVASGDEQKVSFTLGTGTVETDAPAEGKAVTTSISLTGEAKDNYTLTQPTGITVTINKMNATDDMKAASGQTKYNTTGTVSLADILPEGAVVGTVSVAQDTNSILSGTPTYGSGILSFTLKNKGDEHPQPGDTATVTVPVTSSIYFKAYDITVTITMIDKDPQANFKFAAAADRTMTYGDNGNTFTNSANGQATGADVTYVSSDTAVATVDSTGRVTVLKAGEATITATASQTEEFSETSVSYKLTVNKAELGVNWTNTERVYDGTEQVPTAQATGMKMNDSISLTVTGGKTDAGTYTAAANLDSAWTGKYTIKEADASKTFSITQKQVTVTGVLAKWNKDDEKVELSGGEVNGLCERDIGKVAVETSLVGELADKTAGSHPIEFSQKLTGDRAKNYVLNQETGKTSVDIPQADVEVAVVESEETAAAGVDDNDKVTGVTVDTGATYNGVERAAEAVAAGSDLSAAADQAENALNSDSSITEKPTAGNEAIVVVQPSIKVETAKVEKAGETVTSIELNVSAFAKLVATTENAYNNGSGTLGSTNSKVIDEKPLTLETGVTLSIPVHPDWASKTTLYVKQQVNGRTVELAVQVVAGNIAVPANAALGKITLSSESNAAFQIGKNRYDTLQDAVEAVENNETITALKNADTASVTVSKAVTFTLDAAGFDISKLTINAGSGFQLAEKIDNTYTFTKRSGGGSSSSSGGSAAPAATVTAAKADNGSVTIANPNAKAGEKVNFTPKAADGYILASVIVKDDKGNVISTAKNADGSYSFTMPASGKITVTPTFTRMNASKFIDVPAGSFFAAAVDWAVANDITQGVTETTFAPDKACTRAEAVTFLYRAAGSPEVESSTKFSDVSANSYYAKAVAWAVANGITNGTSGTEFSPNATCNRAQIVTFLYRFEKGTPAMNTFADVSTDAFYSSAVGWAVAHGITNGTGDGKNFSPNKECTRSEIVTFLYRDFVK